MAYGIQVATSAGNLVDLTGANSARLRRMIHATSVEGSAMASDWNSADGDFFLINNTNKRRFPAVTWNNSTKKISWWNNTPFNDGAFSDDFFILLIDV